jgi:hypothetical protein
MWVPRGDTPDHSLARSLAPLHSSALLICAAAFRRHSSSACARLSHHLLFTIRTFELTMTVVVALAVSLAPWVQVGGAATELASSAEGSLFSMCSWNCSAINNNPFEYIIGAS